MFDDIYEKMYFQCSSKEFWPYYNYSWEIKNRTGLHKLELNLSVN